MPARVFSALLATDSGRLTAAELAERLQISPAAVSGAVRYLIAGPASSTASASPARGATSTASHERPLVRGDRQPRAAADALGARDRRGRRGRRRGHARRAAPGADGRVLRVPAGRDGGDARALAERVLLERSSGTLRTDGQPFGGGRMTELQQYLAEEVAEDHADGIITRREAIRQARVARGRRDGGVGDAGRRGAAPRRARRAAAVTATGTATARRQGDDLGAGRRRQAITFAGPQRHADGGVGAPAAKPRGGVLVIHENRGLTAHIRNVAGRFAASGWSALALDLLSEEGGTGAFPGEAEVAAALSSDPAGALRRRHEGRGRPSSQARRAQAAGGDRVLLRRRHDLAPAGGGRAAAVGRRAVLRAVPDRRRACGATRPTCSASTAGSTRA